MLIGVTRAVDYFPPDAAAGGSPLPLREMLDTLQNQTSAKLTLDAVCQPWHWMRKCRCICCKLLRSGAECDEARQRQRNRRQLLTAPDGNHTVYIRDNGIGIGNRKNPKVIMV